MPRDPSFPAASTWEVRSLGNTPMRHSVLVGRRRHWEREVASGAVPGDRRTEVLARIGRRQAMLAHPPFPTYCLDESWPHTRVCSGGGFSGGPLAGLRAMRGDWSRLTVAAVNIDHAGAAGATVRVTSMPRRWSSGRHARRAMLEHRLQSRLAGRMFESGDAIPIDDAVAERLAGREKSEPGGPAAGPLAWRPGRISIDGLSVPCEVAERGGAWAVSAETNGVSLMLTGTGTALANIALVRLNDSVD